MNGWLWLIGVCAVAFVMVLAESWRENHSFCVTRYKITSPKLKGLQRKRKVLFLSDLHNQCYGKDNHRLLEAVKAESPDLIFIAGDMLVGKPDRSEQIACEFVCQLSRICDVYYSNGNHEQRMRDFPEVYGAEYEIYREKILRAGIHLLENKKVELNWDGITVELFGLEIPHRYYKKFTRETLSQDVICQCIGRAQSGKYEVLLAHNPVYMDAYMEWGADLVLSGHLHGGIVRIPFVGGVITPQFGLFPKYSGEMTVKNGQTAVVSKGLGTHTIPFRFMNPAELVVLEIG